MKRLWIGILLMAILLGLGIGSTAAMDRIHTPIAQQLEDAAAAALEGHWLEAHILLAGAKSRWEKYWDFVACITDHESMEEADALFARLDILEQAQQTVAFSAGCSELAAKFEAMADMQDFSLRNLV